MSEQALETVLGRVLLDDSFRDLLFADPARALAGYEMTREERAAFLAIDSETLEALARRSKEALSQGRRHANSAKSP